MTTMELLLAHPEVKTVVFVIGDRDFYDLFKYLKKIKMNTFVFGFRKNLSGHFFSLISPDNIVYINDHWDEIIGAQVDEEFPPLTPTGKFDEQRQINFRKCNSEVVKFKLTNDKEVSSNGKKKKKKKKTKNGAVPVKKEEEIKRPIEYKDGQVSHSSTDDSIIVCTGK